jgi:DNA-directed RNA polymerase sigma subunit (sigma70/sigma32)
MATPCPVCGQKHPFAREALRCWLDHDPDLPLKYTLQGMGDTLGSISRERVRQLLNKLGERRRYARRRERGLEEALPKAGRREDR